MKGVEYFFDDRGQPKAVLIDLKKNRKLWEDFQDIAVAHGRRSEPRMPLERVEADLRARGKLK